MSNAGYARVTRRQLIATAVCVFMIPLLWLASPPPEAHAAANVNYFTELYNDHDNYIANKKITFTPDGSPSFYTATRATTNAFSVDPTGGTNLGLGDDTFQVVAIGGFINFYGTNYNVFYVGSNGYVTFGAGDTRFTETLDRHFDPTRGPRMSVLFNDWHPGAGGAVSVKEVTGPDRVAITYQNVPEFGTTTQSNFQIVIHKNTSPTPGVIEFVYLNIATNNGLVGIGQGMGIPDGFVENNMDGQLGTLVEGTTRNGFREYVTLQNPSAFGDMAKLEFHAKDIFGNPVAVSPLNVSVPANSRTTVSINEAVGNQELDVVVKAFGNGFSGVLTERPMYFDTNVAGLGVNGGHDVRTPGTRSRVFFFAEGTTRTGFREYLTIFNSSGAPATANVRYKPTDTNGVALPSVYQQVDLAHNERVTISVNDALGGQERDVAAMITSTALIQAERPMYFNGDIAGLMVNGGHASAGLGVDTRVNPMNPFLPSINWTLSEGTTRNGFREFITLENVGAVDVTATIEYRARDTSGSPVVVPSQVIPAIPGFSRTTVNVNDYFAGQQVDVSAEVNFTNAGFAERSVYFNADVAGVMASDGHNVLGQAFASDGWLLAEGTTRPGFREFITLQNDNPQVVTTTISYQARDLNDALVPIPDQVLILDPESRTTVNVNEYVGGQALDISAAIRATELITVERPMYFDTSVAGLGVNGGHAEAGANFGRRLG